MQIISMVKLTRRAGPWVLGWINNAPRGNPVQWSDGSSFSKANSNTSYLLYWRGMCQSKVVRWGVGRYPLNASVVENKEAFLFSEGIR